MKKFLFLITASFTLLSCEKEALWKDDTTINSSSSIIDDEGESYEKPSIRFKHGIGCNSPLGICIGIPISKQANNSSIASGAADESQEDGMGTARMRMEGDKMHIIFDREAALPNGIVPIDKDLLFEKWKNRESSVVVKAGQYKADFKKYKYGEIWANAYEFK